MKIKCQVFPKNNIWNTPIDSLPIDVNSSIYVQTIGATVSLHPDFGSGLYNGFPTGIPYIQVSGKQAKTKITFDYSDESDPSPYPIPKNAPIEGDPNSNGDKHILVIDTDNCVLYETWDSRPQTDGTILAGSGAVFDLKSNKMRPDGWTSADAAGLPIFPGLVRYDEVEKGEINHAIRLTVPKTQRKYIWPARHFASSLTDSKYPPMGLRFRLKASFDISSFSPQSQIILRALKKYGMILADNGSAWYITGAPNLGWDNDDLNNLKKVKGSDFEAIDCSSLIIDKNSAESKQLIKDEINSSQELTNFKYFYDKQNKQIKIIFENYFEIPNSIEIYNSLGDLINSNVKSNIYGNILSIDWNFQNTFNGLYFIKLNSKMWSKTLKVIVD